MAGDIGCFISYAHDDDLPTGGQPGEKGFVSFLQDLMETKLKDLGAQQVKLWRDARRFSKGDLFDDEIETALKTSALMIVVMSNNWMSRPYCRQELEEFVAYRQADRIPNVKERIVLVGKQYVANDSRPAPLQGQVGFCFYDYDPDDPVHGEKPYFDLGKAQDDRYFGVRNDLAQHLQRRARVIAAGGGTGTTLSPEAAIAPPNGRTIYLAKPASDMEATYSRLALELQARGFTVEPDVALDIPKTGALDYVRAALARSELSIHLVGDKPGTAPDDEDLPRIVKLQLVEARKRGAAASPADLAPFRRIVWAPRVLAAASSEAAPDAGPTRDPIETLTRFDEQSPSDMIEGDVFGKLIDLLRQYLADTAPRRVAASAPGEAEEIFLNFNTRDDEDYGLAVASALSAAPVGIVVRADGEPAPEALTFNREKLGKCKGVLLCWGAASEVWVRAEADRLNGWQDLGRAQQFSPCSLLIGPPAGPRKKAAGVLFRKNQFDKVLDFTDKTAALADALIDLAPEPKAGQP